MYAPQTAIIHSDEQPLCFLHAFIKIRQRVTKALRADFREIGQQVWQAYRAQTRRSFAQRLRRLREYAQAHLSETTMRDYVLDLCRKRDRFAVAYQHPGGHRTSNLVDRLMRVLDRAFFTGQQFHGTLSSAELRVRSLALLYNYTPSSPQTVRRHGGWPWPAARLNERVYHTNWLENLLVAGSMNGYRIHQRNSV